MKEFRQTQVQSVVADLVKNDRLISAFNLVALTGLGKEHILLYQLRQLNFSSLELLKEFTADMSAANLLRILDLEQIHSFDCVEFILRKAK